MLKMPLAGNHHNIFKDSNINLHISNFSCEKSYLQDTKLNGNQVVNEVNFSDNQYDTTKEEKSFVEKKEEISEKLGRKTNLDPEPLEDDLFVFDTNDKISNHSHHKKDGFDKDCPLCECETCKGRRYMDESNDGAVSFQSATKMNPKEAAHKVKSHENEHVRREQYKAHQDDKKIISQSIQIKMRNCPECGDPYVAGGLTRTYAKKDVNGYYDAILNNRDKLSEHDFNIFV